jgi:hypothetical protein
MLFLKPAASKQSLIRGLSAAVEATSGASYDTLNNNGRPATAKAGVAFPGNDWMESPLGDQYLSQLGERSAKALKALADLQEEHRLAAAALAAAIENGTVDDYLTSGFTCPSATSSDR